MNALTSNRPGIENFIPTHAICVNALTRDNEVRNMVLLYKNTDGWLGMEPRSWYVSEELGARLNRLLHEDVTVTAFKNQYYRMDNGIYTLSSQTVVVQK